MNKLRKGGLGRHLEEIKNLVDLLPDKERISISYVKGDEHWILKGNNGLPLYHAIPITDDVAFALNGALDNAVKKLIEKYPKVKQNSIAIRRGLISLLMIGNTKHGICRFGKNGDRMVNISIFFDDLTLTDSIAKTDVNMISGHFYYRSH